MAGTSKRGVMAYTNDSRRQFLKTALGGVAGVSVASLLGSPAFG
jgi:hypothetical protein